MCTHPVPIRCLIDLFEECGGNGGNSMSSMECSILNPLQLQGLSSQRKPILATLIWVISSATEPNETSRQE